MFKHIHFEDPELNDHFDNEFCLYFRYAYELIISEIQFS